MPISTNACTRLRRKWARYAKSLDGDDFTPPPIPHDGEHGKDIQSPGLEPSFESPGYARPQDEERGGLPGAEGAFCEFPDEPEIPDIPIKHFVPADADYNTIWPPMALPDGPPKPQRSTEQSINTAHDIQVEKPAVMREASFTDETFLDSDDSLSFPYPHDGEPRSCPSKHGKEIQSPGLEPSFESRRFTPPQDEENGELPESREFPASPGRKDGQLSPPSLFTNRKARRAAAVKQRRGRSRAPP